MCGICGEIRFDGHSPQLAAIHRMTSVLAPRGPEASGAFAQDALALGHRRLKVMDCSDLSQQPMFDPHLGLGIVFNGAIYNHPELRRELSAKGYRFYSKGDTEVILKAYHAWGERCVEHFSGMFAFAIWERDSGRVVLARDRVGIKPLYFVDRPGYFRFASTLPALLAAGDVDTDINPAALHFYMTFHSVVPSPHTILSGVSKLAPATILIIERNGTRRSRRYWEPRFERDADDLERSEEDWRELVIAALRTAVKRRLVADVPVGVLLSGGLDSSLIVALLAEHGQQALHTYSVGFDSVGGEEGNEFVYSDEIAARFATNHHRFRVDSTNLLKPLADAVTAMSEPMVSHDAVAFYLLSERVARDIKVVQSGQGADEVFAGYHWYPPMVESSDAVGDYAKVFFDRNHEEYTRAVNPALVSSNYSRDYVSAHFSRPGAESAVDRALRLDTTVMLVEDPVKRVDNMTMAWGLEARVPFLDHDLVELAARLPARHKVRNGGKHVLKEAARALLPASVIDRPKGYFPVPALKHIEGPVLEFVREVLTQPSAIKRNLFQKSFLDALVQNPSEYMTPLRGSKLWQVACLELWLQQHAI